MDYRIEPGLYAVGNPTADSTVLVSANYKLSFDRLRAELAGIDAWLLVLDTQGINVWCAAGKGTFGTDELVRRIEATRLGELVSHRRLVVPQLGAPGVAAHEVKRQSGFSVTYGPVRAADLPAFLAAGMKASPQMRKVRFPLADRLAVVPVELVGAARYAAIVAMGFLLLAGLGPGGYASARVASTGVASALLWITAAMGSVLLTAALLPWLPGRALSLKGSWVGLAILAVLFGWAGLPPAVLGSWLSAAAWCLILPAAASFLAMNFTGATTYTSLSGVRREVRLALPAQIAAAAGGIVLWLAGRYW